MDCVEITPVSSPRSSAYSSKVLAGAPSVLPRTAAADWLITPLRVFTPVMMEDMPLAESDTNMSTGDVSLRPRCGHCWIRNFRRLEEHTSELQSLMRISYAV